MLVIFTERPRTERMARMGRVEFEGAVYHVLCRGDRREAIFQSERDREMFLETLGEVSERNGWRVQAADKCFIALDRRAARDGGGQSCQSLVPPD